MKRWFGLIAGIVLVSLHAHASFAAVPSLELAPLKYQATIEAGDPKTGYITVSNPGDTLITVRSQVQGMRQVDTDGSLQFYTSPALSEGITVSAGSVQIPPHGAVNFQFLIDPDRLPSGGVYAAIFFQTVPQASGKGTQVLTSARVGTLLLLQNGSGKRQGKITHIGLPWFVFAPAITAKLTYQNTGTIAQNPKLSIDEGGDAQIADGPYILPGAERSFTTVVKGSEAGPVRIRVRDAITGSVTTRWTFAITGYWRWILPLPLLFIVFAIWKLRRRYRS